MEKKKRLNFVSVWGDGGHAAALLFHQLLADMPDDYRWKPENLPFKSKAREITLLELWQGDNSSIEYPLVETIERWHERHGVTVILVNSLDGIEPKDHPLRTLLPGWPIRVKTHTAIWTGRARLHEMNKRQAFHLNDVVGSAWLMETIRELDNSPHPLAMALLQAAQYVALPVRIPAGAKPMGSRSYTPWR